MKEAWITIALIVGCWSYFLQLVFSVKKKSRLVMCSLVAAFLFFVPALIVALNPIGFLQTIPVNSRWVWLVFFFPGAISMFMALFFTVCEYLYEEPQNRVNDSKDGPTRQSTRTQE